MVDQRFPRSRRLLTASEFQNVFKRPLKSADACLMVLAAENSLGYSRLGLAIAKKKVRRAVDRNRIKRIIRETFRQQTILSNMDIVVLAHTGLANKPNTVIQQSLLGLCQKIQKKCEKISSAS